MATLLDHTRVDCMPIQASRPPNASNPLYIIDEADVTAGSSILTDVAGVRYGTVA